MEVKNQHISTLQEREALMRTYNQFTQTDKGLVAGKS